MNSPQPAPTLASEFPHPKTSVLAHHAPSSALAPAPVTLGSPTMGFSPEPNQIIRSRFFTPFADGREPECRVSRFSCGDGQPCNVPTDYIVTQYGDPASTTAIIETPTLTALVQHSCGSGGLVTVRARTGDEAEQGLAEALSWFPSVDEAEESRVEVGFWQRARSMFTTTRSIEAPSWGDVRRNYPSEVQSSLGELMATTLDAPVGRVLLWHGPPGTGKTTAIRTLARAWREQADVQVVLDPESVFTDAAALMSVLLDSSGADDDRWRILVIEDADELVRAGNDRAGRSLSRMLNIGDGIVGQGLKVLILLTTNEAPDRLHPALSRPGRCMSQIWFRKFRRSEALAAFDDLDHLPEGHEISLAEIMNGEQPASTNASTVSTGTYL